MIVRQEIADILISQEVEEYIKKRGLVALFVKWKNNILKGNYTIGMRLKTLAPKHKKIMSSRLNNKYRVIGTINGSVFQIRAIDDHQ